MFIKEGLPVLRVFRPKEDRLLDVISILPYGFEVSSPDEPERRSFVPVYGSQVIRSFGVDFKGHIIFERDILAKQTNDSIGYVILGVVEYGVASLQGDSLTSGQVEFIGWHVNGIALTIEFIEDCFVIGSSFKDGHLLKEHDEKRRAATREKMFDPKKLRLDWQCPSCKVVHPQVVVEKFRVLDTSKMQYVYCGLEGCCKYFSPDSLKDLTELFKMRTLENAPDSVMMVKLEKEELQYLLVNA